MSTATIEQLALEITTEDADRLFTTARTANHFTDEPVTAEQKHTIYELTKMGPRRSTPSPCASRGWSPPRPASAWCST
ncbi:hypothetical protein [Kocuria rhizophila]|uniref:hypothetical protein n=1 Tax=Kocuria rhizophila TaxID=72000 RepID=UPI000A93EDE9